MHLPRGAAPAAAALAFGLVSSTAAATTTALPPSYTFDNGVRIALSSNLNWDINRISDAAPGTGDDDGWRRQEVSMLFRKDGVFDANVFYDFHNKYWDAALRVETKALFGKDVGRIRFGNMKLHAGLEGAAANRQMAFMENSAATEVFHPVARVGVLWSLERPSYMLDAAIYGRDINGGNPGGTEFLRAAWTPTTTSGGKLHLGVALTRDTPSGTVNAFGDRDPAGKRWTTRSTASLSPDRLVDTGTISNVSELYRQNIQTLWRQGPWWLQGEYFFQQTERYNDLPGYHAHGGYASTGYVFNAGPRQLVQGMLMNPAVDKGQIGTELVARYGHVNLNSDGIAGGKLTEWTVGANWYVGPFVKFQLNYTEARARRLDIPEAPRTLQLRTQFYF